MASASPVQTVGLRYIDTDGDSLRCGAELVRVIGQHAPELHGRCPVEIPQARAARDRLAELVEHGLMLHPRGQDSYRRLLADVHDAHGRDVATMLISEGLARTYIGRDRRPRWCDVG